MDESVETIWSLLEQCSEADLKVIKKHLSEKLPHPLEQQWGVDADTILSAISRSSDLTKRGVRGIIAEAVFVDQVLPRISATGWQGSEIQGDHPYDALLRRGDSVVRIQVKLQRLEKGIPKLYYPTHYEKGSLFVVEVQKTRTGKRKTKKRNQHRDSEIDVTEMVTISTRPYKFGEFDILAVNMHPSTGSWHEFRYTVASWLLPRSSDSSLIEVFQPVAAVPNDLWTDTLETCLEWLVAGEPKRVLTTVLHASKKKRRKKSKQKKRKTRTTNRGRNAANEDGG